MTTQNFVTLPREVVWQLISALEPMACAKLADGTYADKDCKITMAITAGRAALTAQGQPHGLLGKQEPLGAEFEKVLFDNLDSLYEETERVQPPKRPINCGTGHCSCIECVMEPAQGDFDIWAKSHVEETGDWALTGGHDGEEYWARLGWNAALLQSPQAAQGEVLNQVNKGSKPAETRASIGFDCGGEPEPLIGCVQHDCAECKARQSTVERVRSSHDELETLLGKYWELAYSEGKTGARHGTEANEVLHKMRALLQPNAEQVNQALLEALKPFCDGDAPDDDGPEFYITKAKAAVALAQSAVLQANAKRVPLPDHTKQANAAHAAACNRTNEIVKMANATRAIEAAHNITKGQQ